MRTITEPAKRVVIPLIENIYDPLDCNLVKIAKKPDGQLAIYAKRIKNRPVKNILTGKDPTIRIEAITITNSGELIIDLNKSTLQDFEELKSPFKIVEWNSDGLKVTKISVEEKKYGLKISTYCRATGGQWYLSDIHRIAI